MGVYFISNQKYPLAALLTTTLSAFATTTMASTSQARPFLLSNTYILCRFNPEWEAG
jgi:hypothetical protein